MKKLLMVALLGFSYAAYAEDAPPGKQDAPKDAKEKKGDKDHAKHKKGASANTGTTQPK